MEPAFIHIDGHVDLINQASETDQSSTDSDRSRHSRLNDVMIVLERNKASFEAALKAQISADVLQDGVEELILNLDQDAPKFCVTIVPMAAQGVGVELSAEQRAALAAQTASELVATIEKHASYAETPRWKPSVEAAYRPGAAEVAREKRMKSIWLRTLLWLLAAIILGVAYLYLKQDAV